MCKLIESTNTLDFLGSNYNFFDIKTNKYWSLKINKGRFPYWIFDKNKRVPGTDIKDYFSILKLLVCNKKDTVLDILKKKNNLYNFFWEPLTLGILNTPCGEASAWVLKNVLKGTFVKGADFCEIIQPKISWNKTLVDPMLDHLKKRKVLLNFNSLLKDLEISNGSIKSLRFKNKKIKLDDSDKVIFAIPPNNLKKLFKNIYLPDEFNTIINIHFKIDQRFFKSKPRILGILNSLSHWVFLKKNHCSVTLSGANELIEIPKGDLIKKIWLEISKSLKLSHMCCPPYRLIMEKKATYNQSPANNLLIRKVKDYPKNCSIIGDWTEFNFPCSIESSIISAEKLKKKFT